MGFMVFGVELRQRFPNLPGEDNIKPPLAVSPDIPVGVQQFADGINNFIPIIEQVTGLTRREISLQLLKTGIKGGGIGDIFAGLMGQKPAPEAKILRYAKTLIWVLPLGVLLTGASVVLVIGFAKLVIWMMGGL